MDGHNIKKRTRQRTQTKSNFDFSFLNKFDKSLFFLTLLLLTLGVLSVTDSSAPQALAVFGDSYYFAKQQLKWALAGLGFLFLGASIPYTFWKKNARYVFIVTLVLLVLVLIPGLGSRLLGARRWLNLGPVSFQPSELTKLSLAIYMAYLLDKKEEFVKIIGSIGAIAFLVMMQPDMGTNLVIVSIAFGQLFIAGVPLQYFLSTIFGGGIIALMLIFTSDYRRERLNTFLQMSSDPLGDSYHLRQILFAIGSGGIFGVGLGRSRQKHLFLPETASDSVFAVISEEIGFVGSVVLIALLTFFVLRIFRLAKNAPDNFSKLLASGIGLWIGGQMFLNIASMVALTPLTGIPLPFFSYGGSSLVMILFAIGILLNISSNSKKNET